MHEPAGPLQQAQPYSLSERIPHNRTEIAQEAPLRVTTPSEQWAYALEFPLNRAALPRTGAFRARMLVRVDKGAIGIGSAIADENRLYQEVQVRAGPHAQTVEVSTAPNGKAGSLILRNASADGASQAELMLLSAVPVLGEMEPRPTAAAPATLELEIDPAVFEGFKKWSGEVPPFCSADWTGVITRLDVLPYAAEVLQDGMTTRFDAPQVPLGTEHVLDWASLAEAVRGAGELFRMAELGTGWGRWIAAGGALARQTGRDYRLVGVEAEPQHFAWMTRHMEENGFDPGRCVLLQAAASGRPGFCWFETGDAQAWYGQQIRADGDDESSGLRRVETVTVEGLLARIETLDYLHLDIQGAEFDFLGCCPELLDSKVRMVNIGTHSLEIEDKLRQLFRLLGWQLRYDVQIGSKCLVRVGDRVIGDVQFGDGVQVWVNQRFGR